ncbi:hypothetical protein AGR6A_Lc50056 [Agrobacterium sp. NCPPB 925]|nr:hypothetical protein AGR6A_Lc50056 [Agrobacterium sp. NCPPB 925]
MMPFMHQGTSLRWPKALAGPFSQTEHDSARTALSQKADLVWQAQVLLVTEALVFGLWSEIPTTNEGLLCASICSSVWVSAWRKAPVEHRLEGARPCIHPYLSS